MDITSTAKNANPKKILLIITNFMVLLLLEAKTSASHLFTAPQASLLVFKVVSTKLTTLSKSLVILDLKNFDPQLVCIGT